MKNADRLWAKVSTICDTTAFTAHTTAGEPVVGTGPAAPGERVGSLENANRQPVGTVA